MGFLDSIIGSYLPPTVTPLPGGDYTGTGPGLDWGDIGPVLRDIFLPDARGPQMPWPTFPEGPNPLDPLGIDPSALFPRGGNGGNGGNGSFSAGAGSSIRIAGNCAGLWHRTPVRVRYDSTTGEPRQVGGNERANPISLAQSDTGALQFFAPVKSKGWELVHKARRRHHHHPRKRVAHHHHPRRRVAHHHHHGLTKKQLAAGFGGKSRM